MCQFDTLPERNGAIRAHLLQQTSRIFDARTISAGVKANALSSYSEHLLYCFLLSSYCILWGSSPLRDERNGTKLQQYSCAAKVYTRKMINFAPTTALLIYQYRKTLILKFQDHRFNLLIL